MRTDIDNWESITVTEIYKLFSTIPINRGIAGGWALDLHLGKQSRVHDDIDVIILREEQLTTYNQLSDDWMLYKAENGKLVLWQEGEFLKTTKDIWVSKSSSSPLGLSNYDSRDRATILDIQERKIYSKKIRGYIFKNR